jgi:hypothetical protein
VVASETGIIMLMFRTKRLFKIQKSREESQQSEKNEHKQTKGGIFSQNVKMEKVFRRINKK